MVRSNLEALAILAFGTLASAPLSVANAAGETTKSMLAAQIRTQGYACDNPVSAARDAKQSKADYQVWVLKCTNATYRIGRYPDMAAKVEQLK